MTADSFTSSPPPLPPSAAIDFSDGRGREIRLSIDQPDRTDFADLLSAFVDLCLDKQPGDDR